MDSSVTRIFQRENIRELRDAINAVLDVFDSILQSDMKGKLYLTHTDILNKLECVEKDRWMDIRIKFLDSVTSDSGSDPDDPCKLFVDICNHIDTCRQGMVDTVNGADERYKEKENEVQLIKDEQYQTSQELIELKLQTNRDRSEINKLKSRLQYVEQSLETKQQYIQQLERAETVQLWDKEKNKLLETVNKRERELEQELAELKQENELIQKRLSKKITMVDDKNKILKLKQEITQRSDNANETENLKRQIFVLEKDIAAREKELFEQRKYMIGIVMGLKKDIKIQMEKLSSANQSLPNSAKNKKLIMRSKPDPDVTPGQVKELEAVHVILSRTQLALAEGKLSQLRADLPDHYIATDTEVKGLNGRTHSRSERQTDTQLPSFLRDNNLNKTPLLPIQTSHESESHPELVNPQTGTVNSSYLKKHFPSLTASNVKEHWDNFCRFDTNGDRSLDVEELMSAMSSTSVGQQFTAAQIWEAVSEVDLDNSLTIDFYEYVKIADMIRKKSGRADVFRSSIVEKEGRTISKTCSIQ